MSKLSSLIGRYRWLCAAVVVVMALGAWWAYNRFFYERANPSIELYPLRGIDISAHNGNPDFTKLSEQGISFAYIKATEGTDFIDRNFIRNTNELNRVGISIGAYHFFRFDTDGEMQALNFLHALRNRNFTLPPAIDVEEWGNPSGIGTEHIMRELRALLATLHRQGITPLIYTNKDGYERFVRGRLDNYPLWICSFSNPPMDGVAPADTPWHMWQFSHRGVLNGFSGYVDINTINPTSPLAAAASPLPSP
jgi:lysozyme